MCFDQNLTVDKKQIQIYEMRDPAGAHGGIEANPVTLPRKTAGPIPIDILQFTGSPCRLALVTSSVVPVRGVIIACIRASIN